MDEQTEIVCPLSRWFYGRVGLLLALLAGLALFFFYDGSIGYPKKNRSVDLYEAFQAGKEGGAWAAPTTDASGAALPSEHLADIEAAHAAGSEGVSWAGFAADRRLPEKAPERYSEADIREQFHFAIGLGVCALAGGLYLLAIRGRALRADAESLTLPGGRRIAFADAEAIDLGRWDRGVGYLYHQNGPGGESHKAKIDDYKYAGSADILRRLVAANPKVEIEGDRRWLWPEEGEVKAEGSGAGDDGSDNVRTTANRPSATADD